MNLVSAFVDDAAVALRQPEVPDASFFGGCNTAASNSPGIGIATENPGLEESLPNWTLLDQHGNPRAGQIGQMIGGLGYSDAGTSSGLEGTAPDSTIRLGTASASGGGSVPWDGNATLVDLAVGWTAVP